jgi:Family of unknown function (DUF5329)
MDYLASMNWKGAAVVVVVLVTAFSSVGARSDVSDSDRREVVHLLNFLRSSDCAMERNGKKYNSEDAYSHVKKKYDYFRRKMRTTEDFIDYSASKSTISGKFYLVFCDNEPVIRTRDWLLEELRKYREQNDS